MSAAAVPLTNPIPPFVLPAVEVVSVEDHTRRSPAREPHSTVPQVAAMWGMSETTARCSASTIRSSGRQSISPYERHLPPSAADDIYLCFR